jgi:hypothetical protein
MSCTRFQQHAKSRFLWRSNARFGSAHEMAAIVDNPEREQNFMDMMRDFVSDIPEEIVGLRPAWPNPPYTAPEHEPAGNF